MGCPARAMYNCFTERHKRFLTPGLDINGRNRYITYVKYEALNPLYGLFTQPLLVVAQQCIQTHRRENG